MDARIGMLVGGGTAAVMALAVACTLLLSDSAALSDHAARPLTQSSVVVPRAATASTSVPSAPTTATSASSPAAPSVPAPSAPPVETVPGAVAAPQAETVPVAPSQPVSGPAASSHPTARPHRVVHAAHARPPAAGTVGRLHRHVHGVVADTPTAVADTPAAAPSPGDDDVVALVVGGAVATTQDDQGMMKTPAPSAGLRSGPEHPRAGTGSHGK